MLVGTIATIAAALGFFLTGTAPYENDRHTEHDSQGKNLLPIHVANIAAFQPGANGFFKQLLF
jgi:hypothetical protein